MVAAAAAEMEAAVPAAMVVAAMDMAVVMAVVAVKDTAVAGAEQIMLVAMIVEVPGLVPVDVVPMTQLVTIAALLVRVLEDGVPMIRPAINKSLV